MSGHGFVYILQFAKNLKLLYHLLMQKSFYVRAIWDESARVFYSDSDIHGLHIEAKTADEFEEVLRDCAAELILANHISPNDLATLPMRELIPTILWQKPEVVVA